MTEATNPHYIVIEGLDKMGKSTQTQQLAEHLGVVAIREPGGGLFGESLRRLIKDPNMIRFNPLTDVLLHAAQRTELVETDIKRAIESGQHVVSDRNWFSSYAYQKAQGVSEDVITEINRMALGKYLEPDLFILLDADPGVAAERQDAAAADYYESLGSSFHRSVRLNYLNAARIYGGEVIDASQSKEEVTRVIIDLVDDRLGL
jgi:dTMP kinase